MFGDGCHELRLLWDEDTYLQDQYSNSEQQKFCSDEVEMQTRFLDKHIRDDWTFSGFLMEKVNCLADDHYLLVDAKINTFATPEECVQQFRSNTDYDKFNISKVWWFFVQLVNKK